MDEYKTHKLSRCDKGEFMGYDCFVSEDSTHWKNAKIILINGKGKLYMLNEFRKSQILIPSLHSCHIKVKLFFNSTKLKKLNKSLSRNFFENDFASFNDNTQNLTKSTNVNFFSFFKGKVDSILESLSLKKSSEIKGDDEVNNIKNLILYIESTKGEQIYIRILKKKCFLNFFNCLIIWKSLRPEGLLYKCDFKKDAIDFKKFIISNNELIFGIFKVFGPVSTKSGLCEILDGPIPPKYISKQNLMNYRNFFDKNKKENFNSNCKSKTVLNLHISIEEGWFHSKVVLKTDGLLYFYSIIDHSILFTFDVTKILEYEVIDVHPSLLDTKNVLFIGVLEDLRKEFKSEFISSLNFSLFDNFFSNKNKISIPNTQRIYIEFPKKLDLVKWISFLKRFTYKNFFGFYKSLFNIDKKNFSIDESNEHKFFNFSLEKVFNIYDEFNLTLSKKIIVEIIEANLSNLKSLTLSNNTYIFAELFLWGFPWFRTEKILLTKSPFWKEFFFFDLPFQSNDIYIIFKVTKSNNLINHDIDEKIIGYLSLSETLFNNSLINKKNLNFNHEFDFFPIKVSNLFLEKYDQVSDFFSSDNITFRKKYNSTQNIIKDLCRLNIKTDSNKTLGNVLIGHTLKEHFVLPKNNFYKLEVMLKNVPMKQLVTFFCNNVPSLEFENLSVILLDIFQSLNIEIKWFEALIDYELEKMKNNNNNNLNKQSENSIDKNQLNLNNIFRNLSLLSVSFELFVFRIGKNYLNKIFSDILERIFNDEKNCEIDSNYRESQSSQTNLNQENNNENLKLEKNQLNKNFEDLCAYLEELWNNIYSFSNELPIKIKKILRIIKLKFKFHYNDYDPSLLFNCLSSFIFLRFFCPAILNPTLFNLTKKHQTNLTKRTLTLISKILLKLANRQCFSYHKEQYLIKMNFFIKNHYHEIINYYNLVTENNDSNESQTSIIESNQSFDQSINNFTLSLNSTFYNFDKYLRFTELIHFLNFFNRKSFNSSKTNNNSIISRSKSLSSSYSLRYNSLKNKINLNNKKESTFKHEELNFDLESGVELFTKINNEIFHKSYPYNQKELSLVFDKKWNRDESSYTMNELHSVSYYLLLKLNFMVEILVKMEFPRDLTDFNKKKISDDQNILFNLFLKNVQSTCCLNLQKQLSLI